MDTRSELYLEAESANWLNRGRSRLLEVLAGQPLPLLCEELDLLELGAGAGQNIAALARFGVVDAVEVSDYFARKLSAHSRLRSLYRDPIPQLIVDRRYNVICALDVLEHVQNDGLAVDWVFDHLIPGGIFIATVPAYQWLFTDHDRANCHYRRYTRTGFAELVARRLRIRKAAYFNTILFPAALASRVAWQLKRSFFGAAGKQSSNLPAQMDTVFGKILLWEAIRISKGASPPFGLSVVCVAQRGA